jgi:hypothetical protein
MRLPDAGLSEAKIEVLSWIPRSLRVTVVKANNVAVFRVGKQRSDGIGGFETHGSVGQKLVMNQT